MVKNKQLSKDKQGLSHVDTAVWGAEYTIILFKIKKEPLNQRFRKKSKHRHLGPGTPEIDFFFLVLHCHDKKLPKLSSGIFQ